MPLQNVRNAGVNSNRLCPIVVFSSKVKAGMLPTIRTKEVKRKKMDKTSNNIMKVAEFSDLIFYRAGCSCGDKQCDMTLELEYDPEINDIVLTIYKDLVYASWFGIRSDSTLYWFRDKWKRIKGAVRLLFTGRISLEEAFLIKGGEQIDGFITALQEGKQKLMSK